MVCAIYSVGLLKIIRKRIILTTKVNSKEQLSFINNGNIIKNIITYLLFWTYSLFHLKLLVSLVRSIWIKINKFFKEHYYFRFQNCTEQKKKHLKWNSLMVALRLHGITILSVNLRSWKDGELLVKSMLNIFLTKCFKNTPYI